MDRITPSRRALLGTVAAIGAAATVPTLSAATSSRAEWDAAIRHHDEAQRAAQASDDHFNSLTTKGKQDYWDENDRIGEAHVAAIDRVLATPAPDVEALRWKLEYFLEPSSPHSTPSWSKEYVWPLIEDARRLAAQVRP